MNYGVIKKYDVANGPGVRVSLFVSGCRHQCPGCFNSEAWDFGYGRPYTEETLREILQALAPDYIRGLTLLGGEPFEPENQRVLAGLVAAVKKAYPGKDIWCYTGFVYETELLAGPAHTEVTNELLDGIDVLVDGRFIQEKKDLSLAFRGSANQRILGRTAAGREDISGRFDRIRDGEGRERDVSDLHF